MCYSFSIFSKTSGKGLCVARWDEGTKIGVNKFCTNEREFSSKNITKTEYGIRIYGLAEAIFRDSMEVQ